VEVGDATDRSLLGAYWNAVRAFLDRGDENRLRSFAGLEVAGYELDCDPDVIYQLAFSGQLSMESIYEDLL
jgi:hypothetical protein